MRCAQYVSCFFFFVFVFFFARLVWVTVSRPGQTRVQNTDARLLKNARAHDMNVAAMVVEMLAGAPGILESGS